MKSRSLILGLMLVLLIAIPAAVALQESTQEAQPTSPTATIDANVLNVRDQPSTTGQRIGQVRFGESYPVLRGNADGSWWQIQLPDATGWVSARWVTVANQEAVTLDQSFPVSQSQGQQIPQGQARATVRAAVLNVRDQPALTGQVITQVRINEVYSVLQQNPEQTWWLIDVNGTQGWVSAQFVNVENFAFATQQPGSEATQEATQEASSNDNQASPTATPTQSS